jgi:hypothetical protein
MVYCSGFMIVGSEAWGLGFDGLWFRVYGLGFMVHGLGFMV